LGGRAFVFELLQFACLHYFTFLGSWLGNREAKEKSPEVESERGESKGGANLYVLLAGNGKSLGLCGTLEMIEDEHKTHEEDNGERYCGKVIDEAS